MTIIGITDPHSVFYRKDEVPIYIIILSGLAGAIVLALTTFALFKSGFFRRAKKEELQRLAQSIHITEPDAFGDIELKS